MNIIIQNPHRILGVFTNSSQREINKNVTNIKRFADIGQTMDFDCDFPVLGNFIRDAESVQKASCQLELAKNKLINTLFWFINKDENDKKAFELLKTGDVLGATELWNFIKNTSSSALINLSVLKLFLGIKENSFNLNFFQESLELKNLFFSQTDISAFIKEVADDNFIISKDDLIKEFIEETLTIIKPFLNIENGITERQLIKLINIFPENINKYLTDKFTLQPTRHIEDYILKTSEKRKQEPPAKAYNFGNDLYNNTQKEIMLLRELLGNDNYSFQILSDKLALEIRECAIIYLNANIDSNEINCGVNAFNLIESSLMLACSQSTRDTINEDKKNIKQWIETKPERDKFEKIKTELEAVSKEFDNFRSKPSVNLVDLKIFLGAIYNLLLKLEVKTGSNDELILNVSSNIISYSLNIIIQIYNNAQKNIEPFMNQQVIWQSPQLFLIALNALLQISVDAIELLAKLNQFQKITAISETLVNNYYVIKKNTSDSFALSEKFDYSNSLRIDLKKKFDKFCDEFEQSNIKNKKPINKNAGKEDQNNTTELEIDTSAFLTIQIIFIFIMYWLLK